MYTGWNNQKLCKQEMLFQNSDRIKHCEPKNFLMLKNNSAWCPINTEKSSIECPNYLFYWTVDDEQSPVIGWGMNSASMNLNCMFATSLLQYVLQSLRSSHSESDIRVLKIVLSLQCSCISSPISFLTKVILHILSVSVGRSDVRRVIRLHSVNWYRRGSGYRNNPPALSSCVFSNQIAIIGLVDFQFALFVFICRG